MWVQLVLLAAQYALGEALRPRPKRIGFEEFKQTNGPSEIRPIAYGGGTFEITPSRIWYGDFSQRAVERDSHWLDYVFLGFSAALLDTITVAYRYYCGETFALCFDTAHVERVTIGERLMFQAVQGTDNAGGGFLIDDPQAWGGDQPPGEGGQYSWVDISPGNYTAPTNQYLESLLTTPPNKTPSLRGITIATSRGRGGAVPFAESGYFAAGGIGFTPRFKEWKFVLRRQPDNLATGFNKVRGPGESVRRHMNPAETIYEWSVSPEYGAQIPVEELNIASFQTAAETFYNEDNGWSGKIEQATSPVAVVENVLKQVDAVLDPSPSLGMTLRLIRRDYSFGSLRTLTRDLVHAVRDFTPGTYEGTVNKVIVPFFDPDNNFEPRPGIYSDPANLSIQNGREVPLTQDYLGVGDYASANMYATRDGRALSVPRDAMTCEVLPSFGRLAYQGEVVKLQWVSPTFSRIMRIQSVQLGTHEDPHYTLEMVEDQFATGARTGGQPGATSHTDPSAGLDVAPPSATWNEAGFPPDGLRFDLVLTNTNEFQATITGGIVFGSYAPGGQYARVYVTEPGGAQTLSPLYLAPDADNEAVFQWPALAAGEYIFCVQTFSLRAVTNDMLICAAITVANIGSPSVSPSSSVSPSESPSVSPSASESPSASSSLSPSASESPSVSSSVSPSLSPSGSQSPSSSASPSAPELPTANLLAEWASAVLTGADDDPITTWEDSTGNNRDGTQSSASNKPTTKTGIINGLPIARFDSGDWMNFTPDTGSLNQMTVIAVMKCIDNGIRSIIGGPTDSAHVRISGNKLQLAKAAVALMGEATTPLSTTTFYTVTVTYDQSLGSNNIRFYLNGAADGVVSDSSDLSTGCDRLGCRATNSERFNGDMAHVLVYNAVLSSGDLSSAHEYLRGLYAHY